MSAITAELGNVEYVYLRSPDCNNGIGASSDVYIPFVWNFPYINPKEAPYMFIQVVQAYIHYAGTGANATTDPQHLQYVGLNGLNYYSSGSEQLATFLDRDDTGGHWTAMPESPIIQVPSNISTLQFALVQNKTRELGTLGLDGSIEIVLKIVRPKRDIITSNTLASYVRTLP